MYKGKPLGYPGGSRPEMAPGPTERPADAQGRPRLRLVVDSLGAARMELLDQAGA